MVSWCHRSAMASSMFFTTHSRLSRVRVSSPPIFTSYSLTVSLSEDSSVTSSNVLNATKDLMTRGDSSLTSAIDGHVQQFLDQLHSTAEQIGLPAEGDIPDNVEESEDKLVLREYERGGGCLPGRRGSSPG